VTRRRPLVLLVALAVGAVALGLALFEDRESGEASGYRGSIPPPGIALPDFALRDYRGEMVRSEDLADKITLVTFLDSQCEESCPIIAGQIARALPLLGPDERREVVALAFSTDPEEDTPPSVRAFLRAQGAEEEFHYLIGPEAGLRRAWREFQILPSEATGVDEIHSAPVRLFDREGVWVDTLRAGQDLTPENILHDVRRALGS
jgi:protein SCO1/2